MLEKKDPYKFSRPTKNHSFLLIQGNWVYPTQDGQKLGWTGKSNRLG